jgi:uncharacterized membrane protein
MLGIPSPEKRIMPAGLVARKMLTDTELGIRLLGFATLCFGVACFLQRDFTSFWQPVPQDFPFRQQLAFVSAAALVLSGIGLFISRARRIAAVLQVGLFLSYAASWLSVSPPTLPWLGIAENLGIVVGAATIWARLSPQAARCLRFSPTLACVAYGCCSIVFALAHFVGLDGTARMVPTWLPGHAVFWALFTGLGHLAVSFALIAGRLVFLATRLAGLMYFAFAALAWLPGAVTHPDQWLRWAGTAITLALLAAVWLVGDYRRESRNGEETSPLLSDIPMRRRIPSTRSSTQP